MATVSNEPSHPLAVGTWQPSRDSDSKSDRYLAKRLAAAGADYKGVAITSFLLGAGATALVWLAVGVLAEHWLVAGGLPRWARWAWLGIGLAALVVGIMRWVVPLIRYRVNLVYAARAIEREFPDLHNDLVNAVLVRGDEEGTSPRMVRSLKRRAARQLSGLPADDSLVDRSLAVKLAYAVAVLVGLACLYEVFAPKSLLTSSGRLLAPWTAVAAPSRVQIAPLQLSWRVPGADRNGIDDVPEGHAIEVRGASATIVRGRQLLVATDFRGLRDHEQPTISVRPLRDDGSVDATAQPWQVVMQRPRAGDATGRFVTVLPDAARGLDRSVEISLMAGDARTEVLKVMAVDAPSLLVQEVRYDFPAYTRQAAEVIRWQGDLHAVEGTKVTLMAVANRPIGSAWIDFGCDGRRDKPMVVTASDPSRASVSFDLQLDAAAHQASYRLLFEPRESAGESLELITEDLQHRIEVLPDMAPEISLEEPKESPLRVPPDAPVRIRVRALDPDFGLARVGLEVRLKDGPPGKEIVLLAEEKSGPFQGGSLLVPRQFGGTPGATLEYRGVAIDTRPQRPNETRTQWQALIVDETAPAREPRPEPQENPRDGAKNEPSGNAGAGGQPAKGQQNKPEAGGQRDRDMRDSAQQEEKPGDRNADQRDGEQGRGKQPNSGQQPQDRQAGEAQSGDGQAQAGQGQGEKGEQSKPGQKSGQDQGGQDKGGQQGAAQAGEERNGDRQDGRGQRAGDSQSGGKQPGSQEGATEQERSGGQQADGQAGAGQQSKQSRGEQKQPPRDTVAADGTNDGKAMERILEHRRQQERDNGRPQDQNQQQQDQADDSGKETGKAGQKPGQQAQRQEESGDGQAKDGRPDNGNSNKGQQNDGQPNAGQQKASQQKEQSSCEDGKPCGKEGCSTCNGGSKQGGSKQGGSGAGGQSGGGQASGEGDQSDGQQSGQGEQPEGDQPGGQQPGGQQGKPGQQQGGQQQGGEQQGGEQQGGEQQGGEQQGGQQQGGQQISQKGESGGQPGGEEAAGEDSPERRGGTKPGESSAGQPGKAGQGKESGEGKQPGEGNQPAGGGQPVKQSGDGQPQGGSETGNGALGGGDGTPQRIDRPDLAGEREQREMEWGEEDLSHARNSADLAVEHLRDSVAAGETDVLDALGWTREQAQSFIDRWQAMRRLADSGDPRQRGEFERAVRSLGLRPGGTRSSRDVPADVQGGQAEGRRSRPPSEYREQVRAFLQGTSGE
jgi:hypothetical protein